MSPFVQVFGRRQRRSNHALAAGVRKAPRHEIASGGSAAECGKVAAVAPALWGFGDAVGLDHARA